MKDLSLSCSFSFPVSAPLCLISSETPNPALLPPPPPLAMSPSVCLQRAEVLTPVNCLPPTPQSTMPSWSVSMEILSQVVRRHWHNHGNCCQWAWEELLSNLPKTERDGEGILCVCVWESNRCKWRQMKAREERTLHPCSSKQIWAVNLPLCS